MVYQPGGEGDEPLMHMGLLAASPERVLALRLALSSVITPGSAVLEAGCGSLGVMAIIAAKLGARRVVAVDFGKLGIARALAEENGVAGRIEFVERELTELDDSTGRFDVILGMIYNNEPRSDFTQQELMTALAARFGRPGAAIIPDRVGYSVTGFDWSGPDETTSTRQAQWEEAVGRIEGQAGITLAAARQISSRMWQDGADPDWPARLSPGALAARFEYPDRRRATQLTGRETVSDTGYASPVSGPARPPSLALRVIREGRLDTAVWRQDLLYGDLLIRSTETSHAVTPVQDVRAGDTVILATGSPWGEAIPLTVRRASPEVSAT
ncbi:MAG TPA: 50S ribosomal protein L11 methyltransferase [Streptosporangiaceae bacterium]|jgi:hypothetical protein